MQSEAIITQTDKRLQLLTAIITNRTIDINEQIRFALSQTTELLGLDIGIVSHIVADEYTIRNFIAPADSPLHVGQIFPFGDTYCNITLGSDGVVAISHMAESEFNRHPCYAAFQLEAYIGSPLLVGEKPYGTLNFSSPTPRTTDFNEADRKIVALLAEWVGSILERHQTTKALEKSQSRLSTTLENTPGMIFQFVTEDGRPTRFPFASSWVRDVFNIEPAELSNSSDSLISRIHPNDLPSFHDSIQTAAETLSSWGWEGRFVPSQDRTMFARITATPEKLDNGSIMWNGILIDVSELKNSEFEVELRKRAIDASKESISIVDATDPELPLIYVNPAFERLTGYSQDEAIGQNCRFLQGKDTKQSELEILRKAVKQAESCVVELINYRKNGEMFWNELHISPLQNRDGEVTHYIGYQHDITEHKNEETVLRKRAIDLSAVSELAHLVMAEQDEAKMLQMIVDLSKDRFNLYHAHIYIYDEVGKNLILKYGAGEIGAQMVAEGHEIPLNQQKSLVARAGRTLQGVVVDDVSHDTDFLPHPRLYQTRSELAVPIEFKGNLLGVLDVQSDQTNYFSEEDVEIQLMLASQIAVAIDNARSYDRIALQARRLELVAEVSTAIASIQDADEMLQTVVDLTKERFNLYHAHIHLLDLIDESKLTLKAGAGVVGRSMVEEGREIQMDAEHSLVATVARNEKGQIRNYEHGGEGFMPHPLLAETRCEMAVPIIINEQLLGVMDVRSDRPNDFDETDLQIQATLASQIAVALANAFQFQQTEEALYMTQELVSSLDYLNDLSVALNQVKGTDEAYQVLANSLPHILEFDRASVVILNDDQTEFNIIPLSDGKFGDVISGRQPVAGSAIEEVLNSDNAIIYDDIRNTQFTDLKQLAQSGIRSTFSIQLQLGMQRFGALNLGSTKVAGFDIGTQSALQQVSALLSSRLTSIDLFKQTTKQASELRTVAEVSTAVATINDSASMLQTVVDLTKERFNLYHAHIHLLNSTKDTLVLTAGAGDVGREMVQEGRRIPFDAETSLVANVARSRKGQIRNYDLAGGGFMPHPLLTNTRCELAVPITVGNELLGVFDIRSEQLNGFSDADLQIQTALASQIAVALQNARSFEESEKARQELSIITQRLTREGWDNYLTAQEEQTLGYQYDLTTIRKTSDQASLTYGAGAEETISQSLEIAGARVGDLEIVEPNEFEDEAAEIVADVVARLGAHLENLRLTEQTEVALANTAQQAKNLALLNQMSQRLTSSTLLDEVLNVAVTETKNIISAERITLTLLESDGKTFRIAAAHGEDGQGNDASTTVGDRFDGTGSIVDDTMKQGDVLVVHEVTSPPGIHGLMCAPLIVGQQPIGTLNLGRGSKVRFTEDDINLMRQITTLLNAVIENRQLLSNAQSRANRERRVRTITDRIRRNGVDRESILRIARDEIGQMLGASQSAAVLGTQNQLKTLLNEQKAASNGHQDSNEE